MIFIILHKLETMMKSIVFFLKLNTNIPLILLLCLVFSCQPESTNEINEKKVAKVSCSISTESSVVGGVGLRNPPKLIKKVAPIYPEIAKENDVEGSVILEVTTDINGKVQRVKVLRSIPLLDQAAIDAIKQWLFEPFIINGQRKGIILTVSILFELK